MSTSFTIAFDEPRPSEQNPPVEGSNEGTPAASSAGLGRGERGRQDVASHQEEVLAWEVEFTSGSGESAQKAKKMPKFLRDREKARQARLEEMRRESENAKLSSPRSSSKSGMRSVSAPQSAKSKIPTPRTSTSADNRQRTTPPRPASVASFSTQKIKRSPAIKQPLLLVKSGGPQTTRSPERKALSASNSPLISRNHSTSTAKPLVHPSSAKTSREMSRQRKGHSFDIDSPPKREENTNKKATFQVTSKKVDSGYIQLYSVHCLHVHYTLYKRKSVRYSHGLFTKWGAQEFPTPER